VKKIEYDTKGQRRKVEYGNDVSTSYEYNIMGQLAKAVTNKNRDLLTDSLQDLSYFYDSVGNITRIVDSAQ